MKFNKIKRGASRSANTRQDVFTILDAGFLCHVAFQHEGQTMMLPTIYGREGESLYLHGSAKNFMLRQITNGQALCISVTHLDGLVVARTLFDTSANYRSAVLFGKAHAIEKEQDKLHALKVVFENVMPGRWGEVPLGTQNQLKATAVARFDIETASAKIRTGGPEGDEQQPNKAWRGHIPLLLKTGNPIPDFQDGEEVEMEESVRLFCRRG